MAGLVDKFHRMWNPSDDDYDDEYYDDEPEQEPEESHSNYNEPRRSSSFSFSDFTSRSDTSSNRVVNINAKAQLQVVLFKPISFGVKASYCGAQFGKDRKRGFPPYRGFSQRCSLCQQWEDQAYCHQYVYHHPLQCGFDR